MPCNDQCSLNRRLLDHRGQQPQVHGCLGPGDKAKHVHGIAVACDFAPGGGIHGPNVTVERHPATEQVLAAGFVRVQQCLNQVARCQRVAMRELAQLQSRNVDRQAKRIRHPGDFLAT
ncbi:hypothetical protein D3C86_647570 [compost metagenome]